MVQAKTASLLNFTLTRLYPYRFIHHIFPQVFGERPSYRQKMAKVRLDGLEEKAALQQPVGFCRHDEVVLVQPLDGMGPPI
jgi:hypothetical protein